MDKLQIKTYRLLRLNFSFMFRSGNIEHPEDRFYNATVEVIPVQPLDVLEGSMDFNTTSEGYVIVGNFDQLGVAEGSINPRIGKIKELRVRVLSEAENWVILNEVSAKSKVTLIK